MLSRLFTNRAAPLVGIDINPSRVTVLMLARDAQGYRIEGFGHAALAEGAVVDKEIKDTLAVGNAIKEALSLSGLHAKYAAVALSDSSVITKIIQQEARLSEMEMEEQVMFEAAKHIPYPLDEVRLDFCILGPHQQNPQLVDVFLAASRAEAVDNYVDSVLSAGLVTRIVEVESNIVGRTCKQLNLVKSEGTADKTFAVVNLGMKSTTLSVFENYLPIFNRTETFGEQRLINLLARTYNLTAEEAAQIKLAEKAEDASAAAMIHEFYEDVVQHIRRGLQFYSSAGHKDPVSEIILAGNPEILTGISPLIQKDLAVDTVIVNPLVQMRCHPRVDNKTLQELAPRMLLCCGLALRSFD